MGYKMNWFNGEAYVNIYFDIAHFKKIDPLTSFNVINLVNSFFIHTFVV